MGETIVLRLLGVYDLLAISLLASSWWLPRGVHSRPANFHLLYPIVSHEVPRVLVGQSRVVRFEHRGPMAPIERVDEVFLLRWIVILVMKPSLPAWGHLLHLSREELSGISVLDPSPLVLTIMGEVLVIPVTELIGANERCYLIGETSLLVSWLVDFAS